MKVNMEISTNGLIKGITHYTQVIEKDLDVHSRAAKAASNGEPPTQATNPDTNEEQIVANGRMLCEQEKAVYIRQLEQQQEAQTQSAAQLSPERFDECYDTALRKLDEHNAAFLESAKAAYRKKRRTKWELMAFKDRHQLFREAVYPENLQLCYARLISMVIVEATANTVFFAEGSEIGLLGGWFAALIAAGMNVALSFFAGNGLRDVNGRGMRRWFAAAIGIIYVFALPCYHLIVGHYREALTAKPELATVVAIAAFLNDPMAIYDLQTWILVFIGIAFGVSAAVTGYRTDDPFSGYGAEDRRAKVAEQEYNKVKKNYREDKGKIHDEVYGAIDRTFADADSAWRALRDSIRKMTQLVASAKLELAAIMDACTAVIQQYRETNSRLRSSKAPTYFQHQPHLSANCDFSSWENLESPSEQLLVSLQKKARQTKVRVDELFREKGDELRYFERIERSVEDEQTRTHSSPSMLLIPHLQNKETSTHLH